MGGMDICGIWFNKNTGQKINVRDSVIDGDDMIIISDIGNISMKDFSNEYIQVSDDVYNESGQIIGKENIDVSNIIQNNNHQTKVSNVNSNINKNPNKQNNKQNNSNINSNNINTNNTIIDKVFSKIKSKPNININIEWDDFPESEVNTLVNFLDISKDEIAVYIIEKYFNKDIIIDNVIKILNNNNDQTE